MRFWYFVICGFYHSTNVINRYRCLCHHQVVEMFCAVKVIGIKNPFFATIFKINGESITLFYDGVKDILKILFPKIQPRTY